MIFQFFRVSGFKQSPEQFVHEWALEPSGMWNEGELSPRGQVYKDSGFAITLPDAESWAEALPLLVDFIESKGELFEVLQDLDADVDLNIGVTVGAADAFVPSLEFPKGLMAEIASCGINMTITAYPASDEA